VVDVEVLLLSVSSTFLPKSSSSVDVEDDVLLSVEMDPVVVVVEVVLEVVGLDGQKQYG